MSERTDVPWAMIFELHPALKPELVSVTKFVKAIEGDPYAGIKYGGISQDIRNLLYLCVRILIILGGEETLRRYGGIGGDNLTVPMKTNLDATVNQIKENQAKFKRVIVTPAVYPITHYTLQTPR